MANTICYFEIPASDLQGASAFYSKLFGWTMAAASGDNEDYLFISTSDQPDTLGGGMHRPVVEGQAVTIYVKVASIDDICASAEELGGAVVTPKTLIAGFGWVAAFSDPQGNTIGLFQDKEG